MRGISIEDLRTELFDTLQKLKSNNDKNCDPCEKCSIEEAQAVCDIAHEITDTFKVQVQAMNILAKSNNPKAVRSFINDNGLSPREAPLSLTDGNN